MSNASGRLVDRFGRVHTNLRVSVTDRCNIRCLYCMPNENVQFMPRDEILSFEEIARFVRVAAGLGVNKLRLTGGEPLVRHELAELIRLLARIEGIDDIALTTNGILLDQHARELKEAGLHRLNISLDTLDEDTYRQISRREGVDRIVAGIVAAQQAGFEKIRINAVTMRGINDQDVTTLSRFAREHDLEMRFIEFMPLDAENAWENELVVTGSEVRARLEDAFGPLVAAERGDPSQPAVDYNFADGGGRVGLINPVSEPFCDQCNRLRITAEGKIRNCLFSTTEWDARALLRGSASDAELADLIREAVSAKKRGHGIDEPHFVRPERAMYQIGG
ncbi:MAG: GTP 3',8-cyclase MoaA [Planctomycetota bacterium]|nr:MAG: GTP 3',8-cyclase MoaA [Planctomycetota bacterium]REK47984.1 MAG: GTP 3',8-cyclase MoaA [Planctomycetota bacterium]